MITNTKKKAFSLVELLIVIVIIGVLASAVLLAYPKIIAVLNRNIDESSVSTLNASTKAFNFLRTNGGSDIFNGINTDELIIQALVSDGSLSEAVGPKQDGAEF